MAAAQRFGTLGVALHDRFQDLGMLVPDIRRLLVAHQRLAHHARRVPDTPPARRRDVPMLADRFGADAGRIARIVLWTTALAFLSFTAVVALPN
jgi:hypothetical protein